MPEQTAEVQQAVLTGAAGERAASWLTEPFSCRAISTGRWRPCAFREEADGRHSLAFSTGERCEDVLFGPDGDPAELIDCTSEGLVLPPKIVLNAARMRDGGRLFAGPRSGWTWATTGESYCCAAIALREPVALASGSTRAQGEAPSTDLERPVKAATTNVGSDEESAAAEAAAEAMLLGALGSGRGDALEDALHLERGMRASSAVSQAPAEPPRSSTASEVAPRGVLRLEQGDVIGGVGEFDSKLVIAEMRKRLRLMLACYETRLREDPSLTGTVDVHFTIDSAGTVVHSAVVENQTADAQLGDCIASTVGRLRFNPGPEGGSVTYHYRFAFAPQR